MQTKMNVYITIKPRAKSRELYDRLRQYDANVIDLGDKVYVTATIDIKEDFIEKIIKVCSEYGECSVDTYMEKTPSE